MADWTAVWPVLARLQERQPGALVLYSDLRADPGRRAPFRITLAARAADAAEALDRQFRDSVDLTVGALPYPPDSKPITEVVADAEVDVLDPQEVMAELDSQAVVSSGHQLRHGLLVRNLTWTSRAESRRRTPVLPLTVTG